MSQRLKVMLAVLTSVLLAENSLKSQQTDPPAIEKPAATFTARTELVTVPVVVTGKGGKHLTGLKQADFVIEENGHRREIATFEEITTSSSPFRQPANAANQFTNFLRSEPQARRATIIVLDLLNTPFLRQWETKRQIIHFLSAHLEDTGPTSLCVLTSRGLRQVHSFTTDTSILIEALKKTETSFSAADRTSENFFVDPESHNPLDGFSTIASPTSEADILHEILAERADVMFGAYVQKQQTLTTLEALEEIGQSAKGIPGRKSLIWATAGLPFLLNDPDNILGIDSSLMNNYERTWQVLNNASVSVYPIDAQGLLAPELSKRSAIPGWSGPGQSSASSMRGSRMRGPARPPVDAHQNQIDSMKAFAGSTGGKACFNSNDLANCFARANDDSAEYYMLGYYLPSEYRRPGWRKLKVQVLQPHSEVRAREGFFAGVKVAGDPHSMLQQFQLAASSPMDYTSIPLSAKIGSVEAVADGQHKLHFVVVVQGNSNVIDTANNNHIALELNVVAKNHKDEMIHVFGKNITGDLKGSSLAALRQTGFGFTGDLTLPPGNFGLLRFLVRDDVSGRIGTVTTPLRLE